MSFVDDNLTYIRKQYWAWHNICGYIFVIKFPWCNNCVLWIAAGEPWTRNESKYHDDVIKWKHFPRYWPFVREIHRSPVNSLHKGQWRGALMFSLICVRIHGWVNSREAGDLRRYRAHYDVTVMIISEFYIWTFHCLDDDYSISCQGQQDMVCSGKLKLAHWKRDSQFKDVISIYINHYR